MNQHCALFQLTYLSILFGFVDWLIHRRRRPRHYQRHHHHHIYHYLFRLTNIHYALNSYDVGNILL